MLVHTYVYTLKYKIYNFIYLSILKIHIINHKKFNLLG